MAQQPYTTGTVAVVNGSATVDTTDALLTPALISQGDMLIVPAQNAIGVVGSVDSTYTIITLYSPWTGVAVAATVTMTIASPCVVTWAAHNRQANEGIVFSTTGALPTGLTAGTTYYVVGSSITTNTFEVSAAPGGGTIDTSGSQSGTQTATVTSYAYLILPSSWERFDPALTQSTTRQLLALLSGVGLIYYVPAGSDPDPGLATTSGQFALQITSAGRWQIWVSAAGSWTSLGSATGINWTGAWSSATAYNLGDGVTRLGVGYVAIAANTDEAPESSPSYWSEFAAGGDRYDIAAFASDRPASGETIAAMIFTTAVTFNAGLAESRAIVGTPATASAAFSLQKNGTQFGTLTFAASATSGVFASSVDTAFASGDVLTVIAPSPRDATLADLALTLTGYR